jgi:PIN domain nuclease of toxin-antitoxin system
MASRWLLDTSALLALRDNEAGAEHVAASDPLLERAAAIKACHALSVADAQQEGAVLVHKDPEFQAISSLAQEWLG